MNSGSSDLVLKICSNGALYIANTAAADNKDSLNTRMNANSILVGFTKGKWQKHTSGDSKEIRYILQDSSEAVVFNGQVVTVGALVSAKHLTAEADAARVCYHEIVQDPKEDDKSAFYLRPAEEIHYVAQDVPIKREGPADKANAIQAHAAALIPPEQWNTPFTKLHWLVKWAPKKGLQPIRPQITWVGPDTEIPAGKAVKLTP